VRIEKDSIGEREVADDAYFGIQTLRAFENFSISGTQIHPVFIKSYLLLKKAAAITNKRLKNLKSSDADAIISAIDQLINIDAYENNHQYFIVDTFQAGAGTSQNMNINEVVANKANEILGYKRGTYFPINPNDHVNMSQSTNDTYPTAMRLSSLVLSQELILELILFSSSLGQKAHEFDSILKAGRTHLQDAVPIRLGQEFMAYQYTIDQLIKLIREAQMSLRILAIGGSAIGTGINVPKDFRQFILLELKKLFNDDKLSLSHNLIADTQSQLPMMIYSQALRASALELTRIINDLRLLSSGPHTGLNEIILPKSVPGSSIMPGKINPSMLEMGNQVFFKVIGNDQAMAFALQAGQLELNVMMPLMAHLALESTYIMKNALKNIRLKCIDGILANSKSCTKYLGLTSQVITVLNPLIGHAKASELVREAQESDKSILEVIKNKKILTDQQFNLLLNLKEMTELK
jgi:aspartate ammonia-lyase